MGSLGVACIIVIRIPAVIVMMISVANPRSSSDFALRQSCLSRDYDRKSDNDANNFFWKSNFNVRTQQIMKEFGVTRVGFKYNIMLNSPATFIYYILISAARTAL